MRAVKEVVYCLVINERVLKGTSEVQQKITKTFLAATRPGATPVPIPNTMVKARAADGTTLVTVWESRWPPDSKKELWKGRAETALMHLENCIRRNKYSLILKKKTMSKIESNRNETIKTSEVMLTNMTRPERVAGRRPG